MLPPIAAAAPGRFLLIRLGIKPIKYWIDSAFRQQVVPVPGSVLYSDLWVAVEHSGIYIGDGQISNVEVNGIAQSVVSSSSAREFTSKSKLGKKIYVSCDGAGQVGHATVAEHAASRLGESAFYGLVIKNCHQFSTDCVKQSPRDHDISLISRLLPELETWEPTLQALKSAASRKLGATKWRLWDWEQAGTPSPEPDIRATRDQLENLPLNDDSVAQLRQQLAELDMYRQEIADESIPAHALEHLKKLGKTLTQISQKYDEAKPLLDAVAGSGLSYADLKNVKDNFAALATEMQRNPAIQELVRKLGRDYISPEKKKKTRISQMNKNEVHGIHRSGEVTRMLPSELVNLEDDTLEMLFYARLLEQNLLTYQLQGEVTGEQKEDICKTRGPVVACLDTSGSMEGTPLRKAKALLLAIACILQKENRELHVLLFGSSGQVNGHRLAEQRGVGDLLQFLEKGYGGGTDFESPLRSAIDIIEAHSGFRQADVLMLTDGLCSISDRFAATLKTKKELLGFNVYTVMCNGIPLPNAFSNEVVAL